MPNIRAEWIQDRKYPSRSNAVAQTPVSLGSIGWPVNLIGFVAAEWLDGKKTGKWGAMWHGWNGHRVDGVSGLPSKEAAMGVVEDIFAAQNPNFNVRWPHTAPQIIKE